MLRNIVGDWGSGLGDADYARALAALGVLESMADRPGQADPDPETIAGALDSEFGRGERTAIWRRARILDPSGTAASWRAPPYRDPAALAAGWRRYLDSIDHPRRAPRLAVPLRLSRRPDWCDFGALRAWLGCTETGIAGLVLADELGPAGRVHWHWPLRVGMPADTEHTEVLAGLQAACSQTAWTGLLSRCVPVGAGRDACDLLILAPSAATALLERPRLRLRAGFAVCLDDPDLPVEALERYSLLRRRLGAAGLALVGALDPATGLPGWFEWMLREISHDLPVHGAVSSVMRSHFDREALVLGNPVALDRCRIVAVAEQQDRVIEALAGRAATAGRGGPFMFGTGGPPGSPSTSALPPPDLADALRGRAFVAESVDGVDSVNELARREADIDQARPQRWIQADAWRADGPAGTARSLAPDRWNLLGIHIGPSEVRRRGAAFPESRVDFGQGDVEVTVQLELAGAAVRPLDRSIVAPILGSADAALRPRDLRQPSGPQERLLQGPLASWPAGDPAGEGEASTGLGSVMIRLPPVGDSDLAPFAVRPHAGIRQIQGRIAIIHGNRVLQTARLSATVASDAGDGTGLDVLPEAVIHARDDDLDERRAYDAAIQVSDVGGQLHLSVQRDGDARSVRLDDLAEPIAAIRKALERAAVEWDYARPMLEQPVFDETLYALAAHGSALEQHLRRNCGDGIDGWQRIHLVPSTGEFLPLEYVYDGPPPAIDARACPNLPGALEHGNCEQAVAGPAGRAPCPNRASRSYVCPMHFWGFHRLIERNGAVRPGTEPSSAAAPPSAAAVPSRRAYGHVGSLLFAASAKAFAYAADPEARSRERAALIESLRTLTEDVSDVSDWDAWREAARRRHDVLVLVVHTDQVRGTPALEIGDGNFLGRHEILADLSGAGGDPQLLILLGCSAAGVTENFQPYPERFRDAGVSIVIAPIAPIRGADAIPIARRLAASLAERLAQSEPTAFGELLPLLRRTLLREGHPGVMGIVGFGDGDWLLGGA